MRATGSDSPIRNFNEAAEKPESPLRDKKSSGLQRAKDHGTASKRIVDVDRSSQPDLTGPLPHPSPAEGESTPNDKHIATGHDRKHDYDGSDSTTGRREANALESRPLRDTQTGQHTPTQTESVYADDIEFPGPSPEPSARRERKSSTPPPKRPTIPPGKVPSPPRAPFDDHGPTLADKVHTDVHDRKNDGKESASSNGEKKVEGPEPPPPRQIPGRRVRPTRDAPGERASFKFHPELICRRHSGSAGWDVILSSDKPITAVSQNDQPLSLGNGECPLTSFTGRLSVNLMEGPPISVLLFDKRPLIFKLKKDWTGDGRRVPRLTKGHFIMIAPVEWVRNGHEHVEPEGCSDSAFMAHYFFRDGSESTEEIGGFAECDIDSGAPGFELSGKRVFDDSEEGEFFVGPPPLLTPAKQVVWARVGEEPTNGWTGENFKPSERSLAGVLNGRQGRFFVRVYDRKPKLVDSGEFRYLQSLQRIDVNGEPYSENTLLVPPARGYKPTRVRFIGDDNVPLHPNLPPEAEVRLDGKDGLIAKPHPNADKISCTLEGNDGRVEITLHLPRIWWRLERIGTESDAKWRSTRFQMTRTKFRDHADSNTILRLRLPKRIKSVCVGFGDKLGRKYAKKDDGVELPLDDFVDYSQIDNRLTENAFFKVRIGQPKNQPDQKVLTLIQVLADRPPSKRQETGTGSKRKPVAKVRRGGGGWRRGKGFSHREVYASGQLTGKFKLKRTVYCKGGKRVPKGTIVDLSLADTKSGGQVSRLSHRGKHIVTLTSGLGQYGQIVSKIRTIIDRRRKSRHLINVETLRRMSDD